MDWVHLTTSLVQTQRIWIYFYFFPHADSTIKVGHKRLTIYYSILCYSIAFTCIDLGFGQCFLACLSSCQSVCIFMHRGGQCHLPCHQWHAMLYWSVWLSFVCQSVRGLWHCKANILVHIVSCVGKGWGRCGDVEISMGIDGPIWEFWRNKVKSFRCL